MTDVSLVTGGSGFIGWWVVRTLVERGERVRVFDLCEPPERIDGVEFVRGSVNDPVSLRAAMGGIQSVHHLAATAGLWSRDRGVYERVNHLGTCATLDAAAACGVRCFVHVSSATALATKHARAERVSRDGRPWLPDPDGALGSYSRSKILAERAAYAANADGMSVVVATVTTPLGPGDRTPTPPTQLLIDLLRGRIPAMLTMTWRVADVRDAAHAIVAAGELGEPGRRYVIQGEAWTTDRLLECVAWASGSRMPKLRAPYAIALATAHAGEAAARLTGRAPKASIEGVRLARATIDLSGEPGAGDLGVTIRPADESIRDAIAWLRDSGMVS